MSEEIQRSLGRIEGALDALPVIQDSITHLTARLENHLTDDTLRFDGHDSRIRKVERRMSYFAGGMAMVVGLFEYFKG